MFIAPICKLWEKKKLRSPSRKRLREITNLGPIRKRWPLRKGKLKRLTASEPSKSSEKESEKEPSEKEPSEKWDCASMTVERLITTWRWTICKTMVDVQARLPTSRLITGRGWTSRDTITLWTKVQARMTTRRLIKCRDTKTVWAEVQTCMATSILLAWVSKQARMTTSIRLARTRQEARLLGLGLAVKPPPPGRDWRQR